MTNQQVETFDIGILPDTLPFCSATRVGDMVFVSGCLGHPPGEMKVVEGGVGAQTRQHARGCQGQPDQVGTAQQQRSTQHPQGHAMGEGRTCDQCGPIQQVRGHGRHVDSEVACSRVVCALRTRDQDMKKAREQIEEHLLL